VSSIAPLSPCGIVAGCHRSVSPSYARYNVSSAALPQSCNLSSVRLAVFFDRLKICRSRKRSEGHCRIQNISFATAIAFIRTPRYSSRDVRPTQSHIRITHLGTMWSFPAPLSQNRTVRGSAPPNSSFSVPRPGSHTEECSPPRKHRPPTFRGGCALAVVSRGPHSFRHS